MSFLSITRIVVLGITLLLSLATLGISGHLLSANGGFRLINFDFEALALASAVLSLTSLFPLFIIGLFRKGAIVNIIAIEFPILALFWILWLATFARAVAWRIIGNCDFAGIRNVPDSVVTYCRETAAIVGISAVIWLFLFFYIITLLAFLILAMTRGNSRVWRKTVDEADFYERPEKVGVGAAVGGAYNPNQAGVAAPGGYYGGTPYYPQQPYMQQQQPVYQQQPPQQGYSPYAQPQSQQYTPPPSQQPYYAGQPQGQQQQYQPYPHQQQQQYQQQPYQTHTPPPPPSHTSSPSPAPVQALPAGAYNPQFTGPQV